MAVKACRHGTFMFNVNDVFIGKSLDLYGEWCDDELRVLLQVIAPGQVVVDVGANIGTHTVAFAKAVGPKGLVVAFEPQRMAHQTLCGNVALNGLTNVLTLHAAVGAERGRVVMPTLDPTAAQNFGAVRVSAPGPVPGETTDVLTIDDLGLKGCALLKIDVEGMEAQVVRGARRTIERCRPALFVENDTVARSREVLEAIESVGYKAFWHIASYFNPRNFFGNPENVFGRFQPQANVICVPKECPFTGLAPVQGLDDDWKQQVGRILKARVDASALGVLRAVTAPVTTTGR